MEDNLEELKIKKLLKEYEYLITEDEYKQKFIGIHKPKFLNDIRLKRIELGLIDEEEEKVSEKDKQSIEVELEKDKPQPNRETRRKIKNTFRKIVKKTHPDKTDSPGLVEKYIKAKKCYDDNDLLGLYVLASELNIKVDVSDFKIEELKESIEKKRMELSNLEKSYLWLWVNAETDEDKDKMVELFIQQNG